MGLTPLEGLVMGTRSGDIDPGVLFHLQPHRRDWTSTQLDDLLNRRVRAQGTVRGQRLSRAARSNGSPRGDEAAKLAYDVYVHRLRKYVGAYLAVLGRVDAIAFTAGVGENAPQRPGGRAGRPGRRWASSVDPERNRSGKGARIISADGSRTTVLVVPTDEELAIARAAWQFV